MYDYNKYTGYSCLACFFILTHIQSWVKYATGTESQGLLVTLMGASLLSSSDFCHFVFDLFRTYIHIWLVPSRPYITFTCIFSIAMLYIYLSCHDTPHHLYLSLPPLLLASSLPSLE